MEGNLSGIRVLAFQALPPLQFTCHMLESQGASVITIVNAKPSAMGLSQDYFRDKSLPQNEIKLDLKNEADRSFLLTKILPKVDVLLESYRPGVMEKLGLSPKEVHAFNPKIIFGRLSGFGQGESKYRDKAGHDINYLALTGVLNRFRRIAKNSAPVPPANFVADFASGSLHLFNQVLQALYLKKENTVIDCSLAHSTMYLSQLELLKEIQYGTLSRQRSKEGVSKPAYLKAEDMVYTDCDGVLFTLIPGTYIFEQAELQYFNDEEWDLSRKYGEILQLSFAGLPIAHIEKEYGPMNRLQKFDDVIAKNYSSGIPNVFDGEYKYRFP